MEIWLIVLAVIVLVMAEVLYWLKGIRRNAPASPSTPSPGRLRIGTPRMNYDLAPKDPDVMAGFLFDLLSQKLNYKQMLAFAELVASPELTSRYIQRLASRSSTAALARQLAFLCESMEVNGFTPAQRAQVSESLLHKANKEYKLLKIHKNLDKLF